jgi:hypothetical protein
MILDTIQSLMEYRAQGATIDLLISRGDRLRMVSVRLGKKPANEFQIEKRKDALPEQRTAYESMAVRAPEAKITDFVMSRPENEKGAPP